MSFCGPQALLDTLESPFRNVRAPVSVSSKFQSELDILWITVKATQLQAWLKNIPADFGAESVVPLLNGIDHLELLRKRFGPQRVIAATIVESERISPGNIIHRSPFVRLNTSPEGCERLAAALHIFRRFGFECRVVDNKATLMWSKLVFLAPVALSTTAAGLPIGGVLNDPVKAERLHAAVREACAVATCAGATLDAHCSRHDQESARWHA